MTLGDTVVALLLAGLSLYGLGLPLAWLMPAPDSARWVHRIAIAPVYAIAVAGGAAWVLGVLGVRLHSAQLVTLTLGLWGLAWIRRRDQWRIRESLGRAGGPAGLVAMAGLTWVLSLVGYGLYLPNRDFKNHAILVGQIAWNGSADYSLAFRASPVSAPADAGFYPLGLHTVLGWVLPSPLSNAVGITAASAVLVTAITTPLAFVTLARMWDPTRTALALMSGAMAIVMPALTAPFNIGSVVLLVGSAAFASGLAVCWLWARHPAGPTTIALAIVGVGLFTLHVAEAVGLGLLAIACLPRLLSRSRGSLSARGIVASLMLGFAVVVAVALGPLKRLGDGLSAGFAWDLQPNDSDPATAVLIGLVQQPGGWPPVALIWIALALVGLGRGLLLGLSSFPLLALLTAVSLGTLSGLRGLPQWLELVTAPWYGSASRVGLMAAAPIALGASLAVIVAVERARWRSVRALVAATSSVLLVALAVQVVPQRRQDLSSTLAGAGDTLAVARAISSRLAPGETVLNLEGDGTSNLFAYARVPVLAGLSLDESIAGDPQEVTPPLTHELLRLGAPDVAARLKAAGVAYIALGTTSLYWGIDVGYAWQDVADQPEAELEIQGTDLVVLRYTGGDR